MSETLCLDESVVERVLGCTGDQWKLQCFGALGGCLVKGTSRLESTRESE
jgi:hypothetical protein